jgi:hypothetical protein
MMKLLEGSKKRYLKHSFGKTPVIGVPHLLYGDGGKFKRVIGYCEFDQTVFITPYCESSFHVRTAFGVSAGQICFPG